jgi:hypothetical protein
MEFVTYIDNLLYIILNIGVMFTYYIMDSQFGMDFEGSSIKLVLI